jgi:hypothetical protein
LPDLFLRDSHFGNSILKTARTIGKVIGIKLVDEPSELMVISQFGKIIRIDTKPIRAAGRCPQASRSSTTEPEDKVPWLFHGNSLSFRSDLLIPFNGTGTSAGGLL